MNTSLSRTLLLTFSFLCLYACSKQDSNTSAEKSMEIPATEQRAYKDELSNSGDVAVDGFIMANKNEEAEEIEEELELSKLDEENGTAMKSAKKSTKKTWKRSGKSINTATLFIGDREQLHAKGAQVSIQTDGIRARVVMDFFFYSDQERQLEGTFKMRLPQGASPYYFAFGESVYLNKKEETLPFVEQERMYASLTADRIEEKRSSSWSQPKVARMVEKEKAAFAYHETTRRQIDPALAEWAGADVYNCRVFPLMPKKLHRIVIGYDVNVTALQSDWELKFPFPQVDGPLTVDLNIADVAGVKESISPSKEWTKSDNRYTLRIENPEEEAISIRYEKLGNVVLKSPANTEKPYFAAAISPELPFAKNKNQQSERAVIMLDVSLSSNPDKFNVWLELTAALLNNNRAKVKEFNVLFFNVESFWWRNRLVANTAENVTAFLKDAQKLMLEGASDLNMAFSTMAQADWLQQGSKDLFLLSDGASTWGESNPYQLAKHLDAKDRLFAFNTGMSGTNINILSQLTSKSGGTLLSVTGEDEIQQASTAVQFKPWKIEEVRVSGGSDVLLAGRPKYLYQGQKLKLAGRGNIANTGKVYLRVSKGNEQKELELPFHHTISSNLSERAYGQLATTMLEEFDYVTEKESIAYAKHFKVPGKTCSLLMLETEDDYQQYNIKAGEEAFVVQNTLVSTCIAAILKDIDQVLGNAKLGFSRWLKELEKQPGVEFALPAYLSILVDKVPADQFVVKQAPLLCLTRRKGDVPADVITALSASRLDYKEITEEANRRAKGSYHDAVKILSSLIEKNPSDAVLARDVAYSAMEWGLNEQAYYLFKRVLHSRPYEPQTYLAIAKSLAGMKNYELALLYYEVTIMANWNGRFGEFRRIAALEYLSMLKTLKDQSNFSLHDYATSRYTTLKKEFQEDEADLMLVISWNTDQTDIDLHVEEPTGETCNYSNRTTKIGGRMTADVTQGYGPEMYILPEAKAGTYDISVNYYSSNRNRTSVQTKVFASVYKNWGKPNEEVTNKVIVLTERKGEQALLKVELE